MVMMFMANRSDNLKFCVLIKFYALSLLTACETCMLIGSLMCSARILLRFLLLFFCDAVHLGDHERIEIGED